MKENIIFAEYPNIAMPTGEVRQEVILGPPFPFSVERQVNSLCKNIFCVPSRFQRPRTGDGVYVWLAYSENGLEAAVFFSNRHGEIIILNEFFVLSSALLEEFVNFIFSNYSHAETISIPSIKTTKSSGSFLLQRYRATEDIIITLPDTVEQYNRNLGSSTRDNLKRYRKRLMLSAPDFTFKFSGPQDIDERSLRVIVELSRSRIESKGQICRHTEASFAELKRMVSEYGFVVTGQREDHICCGVVCTIVDGHAYMHIVAHNTDYDNFRLGMVSCYLSVCEAIQRGAESYHMLSGEYDYKYRLGGKKTDFERITFYRSSFFAIKNFSTYLLNFVRGNGRQIKKSFKSWTAHKRKKNDIDARKSNS